MVAHAMRIGLLVLVAGCDGISQLDHTGPESCSKATCGGDTAFIGGNIDVPIQTPARVRVVTCIDGACEEPIEIEPGPWVEDGNDLLMLGNRCPPPAWECLDAQRWWVGWHPPISAGDGGLVQSYAITVFDADSGVMLEEHSFTPEYETVRASDCEEDGPNPPTTCTQFVASWD